METKQIPFTFYGKNHFVEIVYKVNDNPFESGFDRLSLSFDPNLCIGYPTIHAYVKNMVNTGYRRECGWIQLVERTYYSSESLHIPDEHVLSIDTGSLSDLFFAFGYPAELYDAPCYNLNGNVKGTWKAYTYLVGVPSRMNDHQLSYLAGFQWGYEAAITKAGLAVKKLELNELDIQKWREHILFLRGRHPQVNFV